jgi:serine/threonine-protein kinase
MATIARAVHYAHQRGVLHRDLKPSNILLDANGQPNVADFGLAKRLPLSFPSPPGAEGQGEGEGSFTDTGAIVGSPGYMAPEQATGQKHAITTATDVYGLGTILYALLTGRPPFEGDSVLDTLDRIKHHEPPRPSAANMNLDRDLETICLKCLEKEPGRRYPSAEALADDLERWLKDETIQARRPSWRHVARKWARRHKPAVTAGAAVFLIALVLLGYITWTRHDRAVGRAASEKVVLAALEDSRSWQEQGRLPEALSAARRANGVSAGVDVNEALREQVQARLADLELLERLENSRLDLWGTDKAGNLDGYPALCEEIFRGADIDVGALAAAEAGERIRRTTVAVELAAALDDWAMIVRRVGAGAHGPTSWKHLLQVARQADPDDCRGRVRNALERMERKTLVRLAASAEASRLLPPTVHALVTALKLAGAAEQALALLREMQQRHPDDFWLNLDLALDLRHSPNPRADEVVGFYRAALALRPDSPGVHNNLGNVLRRQGKLAEAEAAYRKAIELKPDFGDAYANLGAALRRLGKLAEAEAACRTAIELKHDLALAHTNLGNVLHTQGKQAEAEAACRTAIEFNPDYPEAHTNLGLALREKGQFAEALTHLRRGQELGSQRPAWPYLSSQGVKECEHLVELDAKLPRVLKGEVQPADVAERLALAELCQLPCKSLYAAAVRFYAAAFAAQPQLAEDLQGQPRYNAACAAALAGCGQGKDADHLDAQECARLRQQALDWLRADLTAYRGLLKNDKDKAAPVVFQRMQHWLSDTDFNGVRGAEALAKLPQAERGDWQKLWEDVAALRQRARPREK